MRGRTKGKRSTCGWCGLIGHHRSSCHVEADGRREPDQADRVAVMLLDGIRGSAAIRGQIAARIRELRDARELALLDVPRRAS